MFGHFLAALNWQHIEKKIKEVPKGVYNFCLQEDVQKEMIRYAETDLFFKGIDRGKLGIIHLLIKKFKIRRKTWWLQKDTQTIEKMKLYGVQMEDNSIRNPAAC